MFHNGKSGQFVAGYTPGPSQTRQANLSDEKRGSAAI